MDGLVTAFNTVKEGSIVSNIRCTRAPALVFVPMFADSLFQTGFRGSKTSRKDHAMGIDCVSGELE